MCKKKKRIILTLLNMLVLILRLLCFPLNKILVKTVMHHFFQLGLKIDGCALRCAMLIQMPMPNTCPETTYEKAGTPSLWQDARAQNNQMMTPWEMEKEQDLVNVPVFNRQLLLKTAVIKISVHEWHFSVHECIMKISQI